MKNLTQQSWSLFAVFVCYGLAMYVLASGGPEGTEDVPRWAFSLVTLTFTAVFLVGLQMVLNTRRTEAHKPDSTS